MNLPIARGLRGLLYVLEDLSQVDPSDLSTLFAGAGRLRLGFSEIDPAAGQDPSEEQIDAAVRGCWEHAYDAFGRTAGTSLVCIQGHWSNVVDARIKGKLAVLASGGAADSPYNPLYARAIQTPTAVGYHRALRRAHRHARAARHRLALDERFVAPPTAVPVTAPPPEAVAPPPEPRIGDTGPLCATAFGSLWEFALAVNRGDASALALASNGSDGGVPIDAGGAQEVAWHRLVPLGVSTPLPQLARSTVRGVDRGRALQNQALKLGRSSFPSARPAMRN